MAEEGSTHLERIAKGTDKNNAREFLEGKIQFSEKGLGKYSVNINGSSLDLEFDKKHLSFVKKLIETLVVEKSVCEARLHLFENCRTEVAKKGIIPTYEGPDIYFNRSSLLSNIPILPYEVLSQIFPKKSASEIATSMVNFVNALPRGYVPLSVIEKNPNK